MNKNKINNKLLLLLLLFIVVSCVEVKNGKNICKKYNTDFSIQKIKIIPNYQTYNGYKDSECVHSRAIKSSYYKLLFTTNHHGIWVTKYAYAYFINSYDILGVIYNRSFLDQKKYCAIGIESPEKTNKLVNAMRFHFLNEFNDFWYFVLGDPRFDNFYLIIPIHKNFQRLTKKEYDNWIKHHSNTRILENE
jgi:hypothetical protein